MLSSGIKMSFSDNVFEPENDGTKELVCLKETVLKFYKCLENDYQSSLEIASLWNEISLRAAHKEDYDYACKASFISQSSYEKGKLIKAKADALKLFVDNDIDHTEAGISMMQDLKVIPGKAYKSVAQDLGALRLIRGFMPTRTLKYVNLSQAEVEKAIEHSMAQIVEGRHAVDSAALELHKCLQDHYKKAVNVASVWRGQSLQDALVDKYKNARAASFVSQSFYDLAILTEDEADDLQLFVFNHGAQSEAVITLLHEMPAIKVGEDENVSKGRN